MRAGFGIPNNQGVEDPNELVALAVAAERLGFASISITPATWPSGWATSPITTR